MWRWIDLWMLKFRRFGASIDLYCAEQSGNRELRQLSRELIDNLDRELDRWAINS
jgi:hypothetical protein